MATLTYRTTDGKAERLKALAAQKNISLNKLLDELATYAIAGFDAETRFHVRAARGSRERGKRLLAELDAYYADTPDSYASLHDNADGGFEQMPQDFGKPKDKGE